jgi:hypothetical protein
MIPLLLLPAIFTLYAVPDIITGASVPPQLILFTELALFRVFRCLLIVWRSEVTFLAL